MIKNSRLRSIYKTLSWRLTATLATILLVYLFTGNVGIAFTVGSLEVVVKMLLYYFHERTWERVQFGKQKPANQPAVLWFTGLSGAGKTTIAKQVQAALKGKAKVEWLDGDLTREYFPQTGYSKEARDAHVLKAGFIASLLERNGVTVIASYIAPYEEARAKVRGLCRHFVEIYVATSIEECERRDVKGLYARARAGEIKQFTGIDDPYQAPQNPELTIETQSQTPQEAADHILAYLKKQNLVLS